MRLLLNKKTLIISFFIVFILGFFITYVSQNSYINTWQGKLYGSFAWNLLMLFELILLLYVVLYIYMLPSIVAHLKSNFRFNQILIINLLLGWSLVGWVIALVMSVDKKLNNNLIDRNIQSKMQELNSLHQQGLITTEEFESKRKEFLNSI